MQEAKATHDNGRTPTFLLYAAPLVTVAIWGLTSVMLKHLLETVSPMALVFIRFLGAIVLSLAMLLWREGTAALAVDRRDLPRFFWAGLFGYTIYQTNSVIGLDRSTAFSSALLLTTIPVWSALGVVLARMETVHSRQWAGIAVALAGVVVFVSEKVVSGLPGAGVGDLLTLFAAMSFSVYGLANKSLLTRHSATAVQAWTMILGAVPLLFISLPGALAQNWVGLGAWVWLMLLTSAVLPIYVAYLLWNWSIARLGVARTTPFLYLSPVWSGVAAYFLLGEGFGFLKVAGAVLVVVGLALSARRAERPLHADRPVP